MFANVKTYPVLKWPLKKVKPVSDVKLEPGGRLVNGTNTGIDGIPDHKRKVEVS